MADPLSSFLNAKSSGLGIQRQQQGLQAQKFNLGQAQKTAGQNQSLQGAKLLGQVINRAKQIKDPNVRLAMFEKARPILEKFDVALPPNIAVENVTDEGLIPLETGLGQTMQRLTARQSDMESESNALVGTENPDTPGVPFTKQSAMQKLIRTSRNIDTKAGTDTAGERLSRDLDASNQFAASQADIEGKKETAKLESQLALKPKIQSAIKLAESEALARGETITDLARAEAALPGLTEVVTQLKSLAGDATFTLAGKGFNEIAKQFGYSTAGSTARASMVSIVDNQVLPLLRPIFGAAFTAAEGDRLRNAMLDPESTDESRKAQLDAFLGQMERNIQAKKFELGLEKPARTQDEQALEWANSNPDDPRARQILQLQGGQ